jgi:hypothetical protein
MTSHPQESAKKRMKMINNQVELSEECLRELSTFTFDFEKVSTIMRSTRPQLYFRVQEAVAKVYANKYVVIFNL